jgi:hypothetical protein
MPTSLNTKYSTISIQKKKWGGNRDASVDCIWQSDDKWHSSVNTVEKLSQNDQPWRCAWQFLWRRIHLPLFTVHSSQDRSVKCETKT